MGKASERRGDPRGSVPITEVCQMALGFTGQARWRFHLRHAAPLGAGRDQSHPWSGRRRLREGRCLASLTQLADGQGEGCWGRRQCAGSVRGSWGPSPLGKERKNPSFTPGHPPTPAGHHPPQPNWQVDGIEAGMCHPWPAGARAQSLQAGPRQAPGKPQGGSGPPEWPQELVTAGLAGSLWGREPLGRGWPGMQPGKQLQRSVRAQVGSLVHPFPRPFHPVLSSGASLPSQGAWLGT